MFGLGHWGWGGCLHAATGVFMAEDRPPKADEKHGILYLTCKNSRHHFLPVVARKSSLSCTRKQAVKYANFCNLVLAGRERGRFHRVDELR
jgi:hypothetical protein